MSELTHEKDFREALERIVKLSDAPPGYHSDFIRGQIMEVAQAVLSNAKASDSVIIDLKNGKLRAVP
jgi:hypothetical protein